MKAKGERRTRSIEKVQIGFVQITLKVPVAKNAQKQHKTKTDWSFQMKERGAWGVLCVSSLRRLWKQSLIASTKGWVGTQTSMDLVCGLQVINLGWNRTVFVVQQHSLLQWKPKVLVRTKKLHWQEKDFYHRLIIIKAINSSTSFTFYSNWIRTRGRLIAPSNRCHSRAWWKVRCFRRNT